MKLSALALFTVAAAVAASAMPAGLPSVRAASDRFVPRRERPAAPAAPVADFVPGEIVVGFRQPDGSANAASKREQRAAEVAAAFGLEVEPAPGLEAVGAAVLRAPAFGSDARALARAVAALPDVEYAEPNYLFYLQSTPSDPLYAGVEGIPTDLQRWTFDGLGDNRVLDAEAAWDVTLGDPSVVVAVLDSGTDTNCPEFRHLWVNRRETAGNGADDDGNGYADDVNGYDFVHHRGDVNPDPGNGLDDNEDGRADESCAHGTFAASLVGAAHDDVGMAGAAPECSIMTIKIFGDENGVAADQLAEAIKYAADNGADVMNMSLASFANSKAIRKAVDYAEGKNVIAVAAAGNGNLSYPQYPASYAGVISVGGSDGAFAGDFNPRTVDGRWHYSQFGPSAVDVVAPAEVLGASVVSTARNAEDPTLPVGSTEYVIGAGTSFAAPFVAGLAALVVTRDEQLHGRRTLGSRDVEALLESTAVDLPYDADDPISRSADWDGRGRVDFAAALAAIPSAAPPNPVVTRANFHHNLLGLTVEHLTPETTIEVNGTAVTKPVQYSYLESTLKVVGTRKALGLKASGNRVVVIDRGVRSPELAF